MVHDLVRAGYVVLCPSSCIATAVCGDSGTILIESEMTARHARFVGLKNSTLETKVSMATLRQPHQSRLRSSKQQSERSLQAELWQHPAQ